MQLDHLEQSFEDAWTKIKLRFYQRIFARFEQRESSLSAIETFSVEVIDALDEPTISEFAQFVGISPANAAYKIQKLVKKGYVEKIQSPDDKREYNLRLTERYDVYRDFFTESVHQAMQRVRSRLSPEEQATMQRILDAVNEEL